MPPKKIHKDFVETLGKETPSYSTVKKWVAEFKRGKESIEDDGRSGCPKDGTTDENVKVMHTLVMCDRRRDLRSIAKRSGHKFWEQQNQIPDRHLRYVKGLGKMGAANVDG